VHDTVDVTGRKLKVLKASLDWRLKIGCGKIKVTESFSNYKSFSNYSHSYIFM
jgi:hypothetical protein